MRGEERRGEEGSQAGRRPTLSGGRRRESVSASAWPDRWRESSSKKGNFLARSQLSPTEQSNSDAAAAAAQCSMLDARCSMPNTQYSTLDTQHSMAATFLCQKVALKSALRNYLPFT